MEKLSYPIQKPKPSCMIVPALLFCIGGVIVSIINLFYDFSFSSFISSLLIGGVCAVISYAIIINVFTKGEFIVSENGVEAIGLSMFSYRQALSWDDINSIDVNYNQTVMTRILTIKTPKSNLPLQILEKMVEDFDELCSRILAYYEKSQGVVREREQPQSAPKPQTRKVNFDDIKAIRSYCRYLAQQWWQVNNVEEAVCDGCNAPLSKGNGLLIGTYLYCGSCANEKFGPTDVEVVMRLRSDPNFFGRGVLEKAREYALNNRADEN